MLFVAPQSHIAAQECENGEHETRRWRVAISIPTRSITAIKLSRHTGKDAGIQCQGW
jgi:hypothetical protein